MKYSMLLASIVIVGCAGANESASSLADASTNEENVSLVNDLWTCQEEGATGRAAMKASFYFQEVSGDQAVVNATWGVGEAIPNEKSLTMSLTELESFPPKLRAQAQDFGATFTLDILLPDATTGSAIIDDEYEETRSELVCKKDSDIVLPSFTEESLIDEVVRQFEASNSYSLIQEELDALLEAGHTGIEYRWIDVVSPNGQDATRFRGGKLGLTTRLKVHFQLDLLPLGTEVIDGRPHSKVQSPIITVDVDVASFNTETHAYSFPIYRVKVNPNVGYLAFSGPSSAGR